MLESLRNKKILLIVAHPDDEVLGPGGTMNRLIHEFDCSVRAIILGEGITSRSEVRDTEKWKSQLEIHRSNIETARKLIGYESVGIYDFPDNRFDTVALLDLIKAHSFELKHTIVMETGGMKGQRKELVKSELHALLKKGFGVDTIHSEYGMTELLSQAYSKGKGLFETPPWMKILTRDPEDALTIQPIGKSGGVNIIDLANINSCAFIATQDLGKIKPDGRFEVLGRFDQSDIRGCNLMVL